MRAAALLATAFLALPAPLGAQMEITETLWLTGSAAQPGAQLGTAVAIDGDVAVLGAPYQDVAGVGNAGLVVVYERRHGFWTEAQLLNAPTAGLGDEFGRRVAVGGDTIAVGSRKTLPGGKPGTVHVFRRGSGGWGIEAELFGSDAPTDLSDFPTALEVEGDVLIGTARFNDHSGFENVGAAYVFERQGTAWNEVAKLVASDVSHNSTYFGDSAALDGDRLAIGAPGTSVTGTGFAQGAVYVFERGSAGWVEVQKVTALLPLAFQYHGAGIALSGPTLLASNGMGNGVLFVYRHDGGAFAWETTLLPPPPGEPTGFGLALDVEGDRAYVGAPYWSSSSGRMHVFHRREGSWREVLRLTGTSAISGDHLSWDMEISGDTVLLGAPKDQELGSVAGSGFLYALGCGLPSPASVAVRLGTPPNPDVLAPVAGDQPIQGTLFAVAIDHAAFVPAALQDALLVTELPAELASPWGTVLCDPASAVGWFQGPPGAPFQLAIPAACSLVGRTFCVQGAAFDAGGISALTNALDLVLGTYSPAVP